MKLTTDKIYKSYSGKSESFNQEERSIISTITTSTPDRYGDIVQPQGAKLEAYRKNSVVLLNHSMNSLPIGKNVWIKENENGLVAKTVFAKTAIAEDVMNLYKDGFMNAFSIGFIPLNHTNDEQGRTVFTDWELLEYSAVSVPANPEAISLMMKSVHSEEMKEQLNDYQKSIELEMKIKSLESEIERIKNVEDKVFQLEEYFNQMKQDKEDKQFKEVMIKTITEKLNSLENKLKY